MIRYLQVQVYWFLVFSGCWWVTILGAADTTFSSNTTLTQDLYLAASGRTLITANATIDGAGYFWQCPITPEQVIVVSAGVTATLQNLLVRDFSSAHLSLGSSSSIIFGNNTVVQTLGDQTLTNPLNFAGNSALLGLQNAIDLAGGGSIIVQPGGCLTIANLSLVNVASSNLYCVDNTGSIKFENVTISIPDTWTWSHGSFAVAKNVELFDGIFVYASGMTSTVSANSRLILSNNLTFSYDPAILAGQSVASKLGLAFTNTTSWLVLNGCSLYVTNIGMKLMRGSLEVNGQNNFYSDALTATSQGLLLGDGVTFTNDFVIKKFNANLAGITVKKGLLTYQNVEISPGPPICYGDAIVLKHKTYGFDLAMTLSNSSNNGWYRWLIYGLSLPSTDTRVQFFVEPADSVARFGSVGTTIKSGDRIRLESVYTQHLGRASYGSVLTFAADDGTWAPIATPCPPYYAAISTVNGYAHQQPSYNITSCYCIYKPGANVGDLIYPKDTIYLVSWYYISSIGIPVYFGSTNQTINNDSTVVNGYSFANQLTSTSQEVFIYVGSVANSVPNNFSRDYYWQIDNVISQAYLAALSGVPSPYDPGNGPYNQTQNFTGWPTASTFQWAVGYPS